MAHMVGRLFQRTPTALDEWKAWTVELLEELARLQAIERRAQKVAAAVTEPATVFNVHYILTGEAE